MSKTIKELADELGISKTAVRKRFTDEFKALYVETMPDGSLRVNDTGCKLISESLRKLAKTSETNFSETSENHDFQAIIDMQKETIAILKAQLSVKDEQIGQLTSALESATNALNAAQALNAADKQTLMTLTERENQRNMGFWERRAAKRAEKKSKKAPSSEAE